MQSLITAILTSHNRRAKTVACLQSFFAQEPLKDIRLSAVLVDAGSEDGTAEVVSALDERATVVAASNDLYWAAGMAIAEEMALRKSPNFLLWLNDDSILDRNAIATLLSVEKTHEGACIVVGGMRDPESGELTYSGMRRHRFHPARFDRVTPESRPVRVDTFEGNAVLLSRRAAKLVGPIDGRFVHAAADYDFGLRAQGAGVVCLLAPGTVGTCAYDHEYAPWLDDSRPLLQRVRLLLGTKGVPPRSRARYLRRHGGPLWPVFWVGPYARFALSLVREQRVERQ